MSSLHSPKYQKLIEQLIQSRKEAGLMQSDVAKRLKKPQSYISKIETCQRRLDVLELMELAKLYEVEVLQLLSVLG